MWCILRWLDEANLFSFFFFQPFTKFVQVGRVVYIAKGDCAGKIAVIVDIIDQNRVGVERSCNTLLTLNDEPVRNDRNCRLIDKWSYPFFLIMFSRLKPFNVLLLSEANCYLFIQALLDGPTSGVPRQARRYTELHLTNLVVKIPRGATEKTVRIAWEAAKINDKWNATTWARRIEKRNKVWINKAGINPN